MKCTICKNEFTTGLIEVKTENPYGPIESTFWCPKQYNQMLADLLDPTIPEDAYIPANNCPNEENNAD